MIKIALAALLVSAQPATAHCYRYWHFKRPQYGCGVTHVAYRAPAPAKSYYVEITTPPPAPTPAIKTIPLPNVDPVEPDLRTPEQIADQAGHDAAVADHKDEINKLMIILKAKEAAKEAVGIK